LLFLRLLLLLLAIHCQPHRRHRRRRRRAGIQALDQALEPRHPRHLLLRGARDVQLKLLCRLEHEAGALRRRIRRDLRRRHHAGRAAEVQSQPDLRRPTDAATAAAAATRLL
jgi:hypothetical protein